MPISDHPRRAAATISALAGRARGTRAVRVAACIAVAFVVINAVATVPPAATPRAIAAGGEHQSPYASPETAYEQGMEAWRARALDQAVPALRYAADNDVFLAQFYLARIYADGSTSYTDHAAAYRLYEKIGTDFADIDPEDDQRAPFVAHALTAYAIYVREGISEIDLKPDSARAVEILVHAAQVFNYEDAQFELAKLLLKGDGVPRDPRAAMHWLSLLTRHGHAPAQAFLADILWHGRYNIIREPARALALITIAVENATDTERIWIEDIYQNIYCGAAEGVRRQAQPMLSGWRRRYGRTVPTSERYGLGALPPRADRICNNGEAVTLLGTRHDRLSNAPSLESAGRGLGFMPDGVFGVGASDR